MLCMTLSDEDLEALERADLMVREAKAIHEHMRAVRERTIREAAENNATYREIASASGVSYQRVAQLVTGQNPPTRDEGDHLRYKCPKCGAGVGKPCEGKARWQAHLDRDHLAINAFYAMHPELDR